MPKTDPAPTPPADGHVCSTAELSRCHANRDGDCCHAECPQLRDGEPRATGRHCPLDVRDEDDSWLDDDEPECERCRGDGRDPWTDYLLPCPLCQGEQH